MQECIIEWVCFFYVNLKHDSKSFLCFTIPFKRNKNMISNHVKNKRSTMQTEIITPDFFKGSHVKNQSFGTLPFLNVRNMIWIHLILF